MVVDAGPDPRLSTAACAGSASRRVPLVLLTHFHADHVEGLPGVLRGRRVGEVALGSYGEPADELAPGAALGRGPACPSGRWSWASGCRSGPCRWQVLWPARVIDEDSVPNNASVVLLVRSHGLRLLLTGDVEPPAQQALLRPAAPAPGRRAEGAAPRLGYQDPDLLAEARPRLALISVGADNDYGHPAPADRRARCAAPGRWSGAPTSTARWSWSGRRTACGWSPPGADGGRR